MSDSNPHKCTKAERTQAYFIATAKQMILKDGISNTSVRKIAAQAGYSYATLYNHFGGMEELLLQTKISMMNDFFAFVKEKLPNGVSGIEDIKILNRLHLSYYFENPNIFEFFYQYQIRPQKIDLPILLEFSSTWRGIFERLAKRQIIPANKVDLISKTLIYSIHGILTLCFSNNALSFDSLCSDLDHITEMLLRTEESTPCRS